MNNPERLRYQRWIFWLVVLVIVLVVLREAKGAEVPAGFVSQPELATRAADIAGKTISIYCPTDQAAWQNYAASIGGTGIEQGYAPYVGGNVAYIALQPCAIMLGKLHRQPTTLNQMGDALLTLAHETEHLAGHRDEHETDCAALAQVRSLARRFGYRDPFKLRNIYLAAADSHNAKPRNYSGPCVT